MNPTNRLLCMGLLIGSLAIGARGQPAPGGGFDPAQMQQRMLDNLKQQLGSSDEEFNVLRPKIEQIMKLQMDQRAGMMRAMFGGQGPFAAFGNQQPDSELQKAQAALQQVLDNPNSSAEMFKTAMAQVRAAMTNFRAQMAKAQDELRDLVTVRQEAVLVMMGYLE